MKTLLATVSRRLAPRTVAGLRDLQRTREQHGDLSRLVDENKRLIKRLERAESDLREVRAEIDELRRDGRHVAELYDLVFAKPRG